MVRVKDSWGLLVKEEFDNVFPNKDSSTDLSLEIDMFRNSFFFF